MLLLRQADRRLGLCADVAMPCGPTSSAICFQFGLYVTGAIRRLTLKGTELANAYVGTLRLKLLKIGAVILCNTRRMRFPAIKCLSLPATVLPRRRQTRTGVIRP
ncbi:MAG: hypothetical protein R8K46_05650 [Mariprofundaceae bacterium]